jgi:hypothetical protein
MGLTLLLWCVLHELGALIVLLLWRCVAAHTLLPLVADHWQQFDQEIKVKGQRWAQSVALGKRLDYLVDLRSKKGEG